MLTPIMFLAALFLQLYWPLQHSPAHSALLLLLLAATSTPLALLFFVNSLNGPSSTTAPVVNGFPAPPPSRSTVASVLYSLLSPSNTAAPVINSLPAPSRTFRPHLHSDTTDINNFSGLFNTVQTYPIPPANPK